MNGGGRGGTTVITTTTTTTLQHGSDSPEEIDAAVEEATRGHASASVAAVAADAADSTAIVPTAKRARLAKKWAQVGLVEPKPGMDLKTHVMQLTHQPAVCTGCTYTNNRDGTCTQLYSCEVGGRKCPWMARTRTPITGDIVVEVSGEHHHVEKTTQGVTLNPIP